MRISTFALTSVSLFAIAAPAVAQEQTVADQAQAGDPAAVQPSDAEQATEDEQAIIVTGTLIKGVAPVGSNVIGVTSEDIQEIGATNATDLLRKIPQAGDFNSLPQPTTTSSIPYSPIQLRGVGGLSGMATLILLDGKRIVPTAPGMNWIDTQMIPTGAIERVEVVADGGSSIYGSDAVAGVVNFVTKRKQEGISASVSYGIGKGSYDFYDLSVTGGHVWGSGSAVLTYGYSHKDMLLGRDLNYLTEDKTPFGGADNRSTSCDPGTVTIAGTPYALPDRSAGTTNYCSAFDELAYYPEEDRHSIFATVTQEVLPGTKLEVNAFWSRREAKVQDPAAARSSGTITNVNPYFDPIGAETSQDVAFSYEDAFGIRKSPSVYKAWQISPTLTTELGSGWSARFSLNYGESNSVFNEKQLNGTAQAAALLGTTLGTALNPYDPAASDPGVLATIADYLDVERSHQEIQEARLVFDGTLVDLPAGPVKLAFGGELRKEVYNHFAAVGPKGNQTLVDDSERDRNIKSIFGEVYVPVIDELKVSMSARYDHYDDVGSTTNPKVGFTYEPARWVKFRGSWGTSFHAPSLADLSAPLAYQLFLPFSPLRAADSPFFPDFFKPTFLLSGAAPGIKPETAKTWSLGTDLFPADGLRLGLTYWNINYKNRVDQNAGFFFGPGYYADPANTPFFILNPATPQDIIDKFGDFPVAGFPDLGTMFAVFGAPYVVSDQRKQNLGALKLDGIDFTASYNTPLAGGDLHVDLNGTYLLSREKENVQGQGFFDTLELGDFNSPISRLSTTVSAGWSRGPVAATATIYYRGKAEVGAEDIASFTTLSLFGKYDITSNISATVNVDNVFDNSPPFRPTVINGVSFIDPGRVVKLGVNARF